MGRRRILVVDDDPDLVESLRAVLEDEGHLVVVATDGDGALLTCRGPTAAGPEPGIDLALIDLHLGRGPLRGQPLVAALRAALGCGVPLVLLSGEPDLPRVAREVGADRWLEKPFSVEALLALLADGEPEPAAPPPPP